MSIRHDQGAEKKDQKNRRLEVSTNLYIARKVSCMVPAIEPAMYG